MNELIRQLAKDKRRATAEQVTRLGAQVAAAPFTTGLLEVDEPLWGGFWHGDVIAPGYRLPAVELALLRAVRLDGHWLEGTSVEQFVADLQQAAQDPHAGMWTLSLAGEPCVIFAAPTAESMPPNVKLANGKSKVEGRKVITVVCYCGTTGRLHAGYRTSARGLHLAEAVKQRSLGVVTPPDDNSTSAAPDWIEQVVEQDHSDANHVAARLDAAILRMRIGQPT